MKDMLYFDVLFKDSEFISRAKDLREQRKNGFERIPSYIDTQVAMVKASCEINHKMWPPKFSVNKDESLCFDEAVNKMNTYYNGLKRWTKP